jgi:predicted RNA-binding Zn-ribbon protein involved in translation (DUF1610 family)
MISEGPTASAGGFFPKKIALCFSRDSPGLFFPLGSDMPDAYHDYDAENQDDYLDDAFDEENLTETCPSCGMEIYEDAVRCPHCGDYITFSSTGYLWSKCSGWWMALAILGILATLLVLSGLSNFL